MTAYHHEDIARSAGCEGEGAGLGTGDPRGAPEGGPGDEVGEFARHGGGWERSSMGEGVDVVVVVVRVDREASTFQNVVACPGFQLELLAKCALVIGGLG